MHDQARQFIERVKAQHAKHFGGGRRVLDIGSADINGNNRPFFDESCHYEGLDVVAGPNVDHVSRAGDFARDSPDGAYDTIISTECFEHDIDFVRSLRNIVRLVKAGGLFVFTCATTGRPEHGTVRADPASSLTSGIAVSDPTWYPNYYRNLTAEDVQRALPFYLYFDAFGFEHGAATKDLYFWGVRNTRPFGLADVTPEARSLATMEAVYDVRRHATDKGPSFHRYTRQYHALLDRYRYVSGLRYLEIGVHKGDSLRAARDYLPNATHVVGIDIMAACKENERELDHIYVEIGSATDADFLRDVVAKHGPFDIILDDGSHVAEHIASAFEVLFPTLKDGGLYIVEDTVAMRDLAQFREKPYSPDHLACFTRFLPLLNQWNLSTPGYRGPHGHAVDTDKIAKKSADPFDTGIDSVHFGVSFIAIAKRVRHNWLPPNSKVPPSVAF